MLKIPVRPIHIALASLTLVAATTAFAAKIGKPAPDFAAHDIDGKPVSLSALRGKYVVLEWHNKGCPFVVKHYGSGNLPALQAKWTAKKVAWISIVSSGEGKQGFTTPAEAHEDIEATHTAVTAMILDADAHIAKLYAAKCTPHMFVIDPKGVLIYNGALDDHPSTEQADIPGSLNYVDQALTEAMAGKPVSVSSTRPYGCGIKYKKD
jgi:alkyl hydroperoxide reductase subunit AhpC